ncbi:MAG: glycosyltransferase family 61 protein [Moorea sp. SIO3G5]|nr:glycosyltransferase family 61 protein [Moorena sp. SIO3G5]
MPNAFNLKELISFETKLKIRSLGWRKLPLANLEHTFYFLETHFIKNQDYKLPEDVFQAQQLHQEKETYSPYCHQEYVVQIKEPTVVEPLMGGVIARKYCIVEEAFALPVNYPVILPFLPLAFFQANYQKNNLPEAILLRHPWGDNNYFHFYNDILPKLGLIQELELFQEHPIIVSKKLFNTNYFQEAISLAGLKNRKWIIQDNQYIHVDNIIVIRAHELTHKGLIRNLKLLNFKHDNPQKNRKIFLTRPKGAFRNLANRKTIVKIAKSLDFEIIDCSQLPFVEQIRIFSQARVIVGEHGAAFANIIYRYGYPLDIIELFPPKHLSTCYFVISQALGYRHHILRSCSESNQNYKIDSIEFTNKLKHILSLCE